jgi:hypothetical protein
MLRGIKKQSQATGPQFYNISDDDFYHGPAWVIKPRLFPQKKNYIKSPGPSHYHIPDRSVYARPGKYRIKLFLNSMISSGKTIGSRLETTPVISTRLLAQYFPNDHYTSNAHVPAISITPRRTERKQEYSYSGQFYLPTDLMIHHRQTPLFRPLYGPILSRKSLDHNFSSISPGPAAYPMYEFDEDILPRPQPGITQKHRFSFDQKLAASRPNPPFYYPNKADHHRFPSFTIGKRLVTTKENNQCMAPYYTPFDNKALCPSTVHPGVTLKGRWSPLVYNGMNFIPQTNK